ncbi:MAG TPA: hypothetical protein VFL47_12830 [Flavisolibacter sp.]|nr:hypothetical protein [Flavisolibacter sp.]
MEAFKKTIDGIDFSFQGILEGDDEVCWVNVDNHRFRMTVAEDDSWEILQQVPAWIKKLEEKLAAAIDEKYC